MTGRTEQLRDDVVRAWRLSIDAATEANSVRLGEFNWPWALGLALDEVDRLRAVVAAVEEALRFDDFGVVEKKRIRAALGAAVIHHYKTDGTQGCGAPGGEGVNVSSDTTAVTCSACRGLLHAAVTSTPEATTDEQRYECALCGGSLTVADNYGGGGLIMVNVEGHAKPAHRSCPAVTGHPTEQEPCVHARAAAACHCVGSPFADFTLPARYLTDEPPTCEHGNTGPHDWCQLDRGTYGSCPGPAGRLVPQREDEHYDAWRFRTRSDGEREEVQVCAVCSPQYTSEDRWILWPCRFGRTER